MKLLSKESTEEKRNTDLLTKIVKKLYDTVLYLNLTMIQSKTITVPARK